MKCTIPEISWHNREPVLSVDIFPENRKFYRLASGGGDCHVLIWQMTITDIGAVNQEVISDLTRHQKAVNCVRWSNTGQYLASGDDDANIIVWQLKTDNIPLLEGDTGDREVWTVYKVMRGHKEDVYDLCWSMDGMKILSGSVDNTSILWDVHKGKMDHIMTDHKGFVQGVSWDPKNQILATISTDRICRIFDPFGKQIKARIQKGKLSVPEAYYLHDKEVKFFHDDTFKSFFRRLQFTPDGSLLIVPSGHIEPDNCKNVLNATLIFTLDNFSSPAVVLPLPHQSSTVVRCCPKLFQLHEDGPDPMINLPYRMIFAVGTDHDIILYDTQQTVPFARFQDIHYTRLTDITWSQDGLLLIASSTDGFCSLITFEMDELGVAWAKIEVEAEENPLDVSGCEELIVKDENVDTNNKVAIVEEKIDKLKEDPKEESKKRPSFLEQWAILTPKKKKIKLEEDKREHRKDTSEIIEIVDSPQKRKPEEVSTCEKMNIENTEQKKKNIHVNRLIPRRITPLNAVDSTTEGIPKVVNSDAKHLHKPEEKVNVLIPRRLSSKPMEPTPSTSKRADEPSCSTQKPSELRSSKDIDIGKNGQISEDEDDSSDSEAEILSKEEMEELHKASENIKEFFCRAPKPQTSHTDIKPIAVRRKQKESENTINCKQVDGSKSDDKTALIANKHADAKPIEVRRKPKQDNAEKGTSQMSGRIYTKLKAAVEDKSCSKSDDKTALIANKHADANPIEVRRKPKIDNAERGPSQMPGRIDTKLKAAVEDKSCSKSDDKTALIANKHADANPIEVRRKPKIDNAERGPSQMPGRIDTKLKAAVEDKSCSKSDDKTTVITNKHADAKPIEVKRKPKQDNAEKGPSQMPGRIDTKLKAAVEDKSCSKSDDKTAVITNKHADAKPIEVRRKPKQDNAVRGTSQMSENIDTKLKAAVEDKSCSKDSHDKQDKNKTIASKTEDIKLSDIVCIIDSDDEEYNTTPKKVKPDQTKRAKIAEDRPPKIKVSSLVKRRKSAEKTPKKTNALLNFLQKSAEKKTKKQKDEKEEININISLEENEARDAWKCDSQHGRQSITNEDKDRTEGLVADDETEDFCLQLEESQEGCDAEKESQSLDKCQAKIIESDKIESIGGNQSGESISKTDQGKGNMGLNSNGNMPKTPRRVPLITLASPKGRTKKE